MGARRRSDGRGLSRLTASHAPSMVVQAMDFQVWLRLEDRVDAATRIDTARSLTREIGGDPGAVDRAQFGRLPGTTDRTPSRVRDGRASFVVLRSASRTATIPIPRDVTPSDGRPGGGDHDEAGGGQEDVASVGDRDFAVACRLLEAGADDHTIAATIASVRGFDPKCGGDYLPRTIRAARRHIQRRRP